MLQGIGVHSAYGERVIRNSNHIGFTVNPFNYIYLPSNDLTITPRQSSSKLSSERPTSYVIHHARPVTTPNGIGRMIWRISIWCFPTIYTSMMLTRMSWLNVCTQLPNIPIPALHIHLAECATRPETHPTREQCPSVGIVGLLDIHFRDREY